MSDTKGHVNADYVAEKPHSREGDTTDVSEPEVTMASFAHLDEKKILRKASCLICTIQASISYGAKFLCL